MPIKFTKAYLDSTGKAHTTIEEAQKSELRILITDGRDLLDVDKDDLDDCIDRLITDKDQVIDILTTTGNSRPAARKANGGTKRRKSFATVPVTGQPITKEQIDAA